MPPATTMVNFKPYAIPKRRCNLPFVNQSWSVTVKELLYINFGGLKVLLLAHGIRHIQDTGRLLFGRGGLSAPFWPFDKHSPFSPQSRDQHLVGNSRFVSPHNECFLIRGKNTTNKSITQIFYLLFGNLVDFHLGTWHVFGWELGGQGLVSASYPIIS